MTAQDVFQVVRPSHWNEAREFGALLTGWIFRGQADSKWGLVTTLERAADRLGCSPEMRVNGEDSILREFQRRAHHFVDPPDFEDRLEWLALLQHHGSPTRLLDFTHSFYAAVFFALDNAVSDAAVWAINRRMVDRVVSERVERDVSRLRTQDLNGAYIQLCNEVGRQEMTSRLVVAVEPERMNERLAAQQGLFLFAFDLGVSFEENLAETFRLNPTCLQSSGFADRSTLPTNTVANVCIIKIVLPKAYHLAAIEDLRKWGIYLTPVATICWGCRVWFQVPPTKPL